MRDITNTKEIQSVILNILIYTKKLCEENNIRYFLAGGTLLGAIRHKGFIPWDNDVDIAMPRPDYERMIKLLETKAIKEPYKLLIVKNGSNYYYPFAKIVDTRTVLIEKTKKNPIDGCGLYIDIFPIDGHGNVYNSAFRRYKRLSYWGWNISALMSSWGEYSNAGVRREMIHVCMKSLFSVFGIERTFKRIENELAKIDFDRSKYIASTYGAHDELLLGEYFSDYIEVPFEGNTFRAPVGYDQYLTQMYGDYMKLPPVEEQVANHDILCYWK